MTVQITRPTEYLVTRSTSFVADILSSITVSDVDSPKKDPVYNSNYGHPERSALENSTNTVRKYHHTMAMHHQQLLLPQIMIEERTL
ncbi:hypothetical protein K7432_008123 [Basidiobolus ranarum]|uniref:Uncharacterized protein n=1 Tax=Basidiobolus ranarum TaxID=34480 RepID=A0ABR2WSB8_9FUNG